MIHLVQMPLASITRPSLPLSVMKTQLRAANIRAKVFNFNVEFSRRVRPSRYEILTRFKSVEPPVGEWLFTRAAFGADPERDARFFALIGPEITSLPYVDDPFAWLHHVRDDLVPAFLEDCLARLDQWGRPRVVAFSSTFSQTIPALALGRMLKERRPEVRVVYGGACFHGDAGRELIDHLPFIDGVALGEADDIIVPLFSALSEDREPEELPGLVWRYRSGRLAEGPPGGPIDRALLDELPDPDFDDYFREIVRVGLGKNTGFLNRIFLPFEAARGCWWGAKQHCTFCGLNPQGMEHRARSPERVRRQLAALCKRYPTHRFQAADTIMAESYFNDLLPSLRANPPARDLRLYWCVKSNLKRGQVERLAEANVRFIQPGIESLSTPLLKKLRKGASGLQNVHLLKLCREYAIVPYWNLLVGAPGETVADYTTMADWIAKIVHLYPPFGGAQAMECHRNSPYFNEPGRWAEDHRPLPWYDALYPADIDTSRIAYYFSVRWKDTLPREVHQPVVDAVLEWLRIWDQDEVLPSLTSRATPDGLVIEDRRDGLPIEYTLTRAEARVYELIADPTSARRIADLCTTARNPLHADDVSRALDKFVARGLALKEGEFYLALALPEGTVDVPLSARTLLAKPAVEARSGVRATAPG